MVRNARIKVTIEGRLRPYTDGHWVVFNKDGNPTGFMHVDRLHLKQTLPTCYEADPEKAFRDFWAGSRRGPLRAALDGYTIKLVADESVAGLMRQHMAAVPTHKLVEQLELPTSGEEANGSNTPAQ